MRRVATAAILLVIIIGIPALGLAQDSRRAMTAQDVRDMAAAGQTFRGAVLSGMDLSAIRVPNLDLAGTNWAKADLRGAILSGTDLTGASLDEVNARGATFDNCDLVNVTMRHGDFSGAIFRRTQLAGADFAGSSLAGATFEGGTYSRTGGFHSGAIAAALGALTVGQGTAAPPAISPTIASGLMGEPFSFVYNSADINYWPMAPFTESPIRAAATAAGHEVIAHYDLDPAKAIDALLRALKAGKVCILPISLKGEEMSGSDFDNAFWGAAVGINDMEKPARVVVLVPPFGRREYLPAELTDRWAGPWPTLEPAGAERSIARHPLVVLSRGENPRSSREMILAALRNAILTAREPRTYTTLSPGIVGLQRLASDMEHASLASTDAQVLTDLAPWAGRPRQLLVSARYAAADFLDEARNLMLQSDGPAMLRAAALYRSEAAILESSFRLLGAENGATIEKVRENYAAAAKMIAEVARIESAATDTLEELTEQ